MRIRSNIISATYAGQNILEPGQHIAASEYGFSRTFSTSVEAIIGAEAQTVRAYGNAHGSLQLPVSVDFASEPEALVAAVNRADFAERNQTGVLALQVGDSVCSWNAGLQNIDIKLSYASNSVRLLIMYNFVLGAVISDN